MDAKANTQICDSPITQSYADSRRTSSQAAYLIVVGGGIPGTMLRLADEQTHLGRSSESTFQLYDITVSRRHDSVGMDPLGSVFLTDEGSTNGTFLNGRR